MVTHSSILAWRFPYSPWDLKELDTTERLSTQRLHAQVLGHLRSDYRREHSATHQQKVGLKIY